MSPFFHMVLFFVDIRERWWWLFTINRWDRSLLLPTSNGVNAHRPHWLGSMESSISGSGQQISEDWWYQCLGRAITFLCFSSWSWWQVSTQTFFWNFHPGILGKMNPNLVDFCPSMEIWLVVSKTFHVYPYLGKIPIWTTNIFQMGWLKPPN